MAQTFEGAQPQVIRSKQKYKDTSAYKGAYDDNEDDQLSNRETLNIMYDKRVFRGNTHGVNALKVN